MKYITGIILTLTLWCCQDVKRPEIPVNLIPEDRMAEVLTEVYLINAARSYDNRVILEQKIKLDSFFFRKFDIDSLQFVESNAFYTSNLSAYNKLFTKVEERMSLLKVDTDSLLLEFVQELEAKRICDSIIEANKDTTLIAQKDTLLISVKDSLNLDKKDSLGIVPRLIDSKTMH
ncbi:MAG: hypothetical protein ACI83B_002299 [Sediminicola sp.]|jgi:hypothetical protein|tara:strand:- start:2872 stop:3396 length:525 start_codon:yes stop_codon:yes gene_type:complete